MADLVRLSFSIEQPLYERLEHLVQESGCENRSEFLRDLIRQRLVERQWEAGDEVVGTITLVFDHHRRSLSERLTELQHEHHDHILASTHVHLDAHICAEVILAKGPAEEIQHIADELSRQKGVLHAALSVGTTGQALG